MPPLIIKVSRRGFQEELRLESRAYKEMESIQGVAVPRCYGLFQATLSSSSPLFKTRYLNKAYDHDEHDHELLPGSPALTKRHLDASGNLVHILVLERLGPTLPMEIDHPPEVLYVLV